MGCCGEKTVTNTIKDIVTGTARRLLPPSELARRRLGICDGCDKLTWLLPHEYVAWLAGHGIEVLENFTQLENLPDLPKKEHRPLAGKYCMRCKCSVEGKSRVPGTDCIEGRWKVLEMDMTDDERKRRWKICRNCGDNRLENIRGVCRLARGYWPARSKQPARQKEVVLASGERVIIREMVGDCPVKNWDLTDL